MLANAQDKKIEYNFITSDGSKFLVSSITSSNKNGTIIDRIQSIILKETEKHMIQN